MNDPRSTSSTDSINSHATTVRDYAKEKTGTMLTLRSGQQNRGEPNQISLPQGMPRKTAAVVKEYQKVILGARAVLDHYQPHLPIHPGCPMVPLGELCEIESGATPCRSVDLYWNGNIPWVGPRVCQGGEVMRAEELITEAGLTNSGTKLFPKESTLIALTGKTMGQTGLLKFACTTSQNIAVLYPKSKKVLIPAYLFQAAQQLYAEIRMFRTGEWHKVPLSFIQEYEIPLPPPAMQLAIVAEMETEQALVAANRELITRCEQKIQSALAAFRFYNPEAQSGAAF